jgi:hypothetical protein
LDSEEVCNLYPARNVNRGIRIWEDNAEMSLRDREGKYECWAARHQFPGRVMLHFMWACVRQYTDYVTGWTTGEYGFDSRQGKGFLSWRLCRDRVCGPRSLLSRGYGWSFPAVMTGALPPLPVHNSWRDAQISTWRL